MEINSTHTHTHTHTHTRARTHLKITVKDWFRPVVQSGHSQQHVSEDPQHLLLSEPSVQSSVHHLQDRTTIIQLHHDEDLMNIITSVTDGPVVESD